MVRKKKKQPILEDVLIEDVGAEGKSLARVEGKVIFVPMMLPGDVVDVQLRKNKDNFAEGYPLRIKKYSDLRIKPECEHFGVCGGCHWQHLPYEKQLEYKEKQVLDIFERLGQIRGFEARPILPSEKVYRYRNKLEFTFSRMRWLTNEEIKSGEENLDKRGLGFFMPKKFFRILDINECHLQPEPSNAIRIALKEFVLENGLEIYDPRMMEGFIRSIIVRNTSTNEWLIIVTFHHESEWIQKTLDYLIEKFPQLTSVHYVINPKVNDVITDLPTISYYGKPFISEEMEGLSFKISPKSFYQTNSKQAYNLYKITRDFAELTGDETVYDLYAGTGTIANFIARSCKQVIGVEYVEEAVVDARINSEDNGIKNTTFVAGDMKDVMNEEFLEKHGRPNVIITDPPRAGMHKDVVKTILKAAPDKIVYVSCNPATQMRDIKLMNEDYQLIRMQPVDMFPHTYHVENVALLKRKDVV
ncbi:MAG: 23S rRNA (uracil(1939)-C(5))-methyltransferase RlmD [Bacteroidota bacterium]